MLVGLSIVAGVLFVFVAVCGVIAKLADDDLGVVMQIGAGFLLSLACCVYAGYLVGRMLGLV